MDHYWNSINSELRNHFHQKVVKLSIDGGFTCPNRDGAKGVGGCIFCAEDGSGAFTSKAHLSIEEQMHDQKNRIDLKWPQAAYIAYFQNFTGTYGTVNKLKELYYRALKGESVVGLAIATRPDCLSSEVLELLSEINEKTFLWIELGLQTIHDKTAQVINRGYEFDVFGDSYEKLKKRHIKTVVHIIDGLPGENYEMMMKTARTVGQLDPWGVKIHLLHVLRNTQLEVQYHEGEYHPLTKDMYISLVADQLEIIPWSTTIHRLTGDGSKDALVTPWWSTDKKSVLNGIRKEMKKRGHIQGCRV